MRRITFVERFVMALILFFDMSVAVAQKLPGDAAQLLPVLNQEITTYWPDLQPRSWIASVIDQESNWKAKAKLKTAREFGCGLGQFTIAYNANGTTRFDALEETRRLDKSLKGWNWEDCYNVVYQMRGVVLKLRVNDRNCTSLMRDNREVKACAGASYNGGFGSVGKRIRLCRMEPGCQPDVWKDNLALRCAQSNVKVHGYGESFCQINANYPMRVEARQAKFLQYWPQDDLLSRWAAKKEAQ